MFIDFLLDIFSSRTEKTAFVFNDENFSFGWLIDKFKLLTSTLSNSIPKGSVVSVECEYSPFSVALLLVLFENENIVIPLSNAMFVKKEEFYEVAQPEFVISISGLNYSIKSRSINVKNELYKELNNRLHPGLVLFSSGTTGKSKGIVHDFAKLLIKYKKQRKDYITLAFMLFDHIGGFDTLFYSLSNGSTIVTLNDRSPENVCRAIEKHRIEVLPATPTFLNLLLISGCYKNYDLSSLKYITYGTEVMPQYTLEQIHSLFPEVIILQKFGTTETGTLRSKSESSDSLWVKIGGEGYETRVVDGILQIKADSAMLGYLNAPSPFTEDGWYITGDTVEVKGEYIRFIGRKSEIINVGGEKVFPSEVENIIQQMDNIAEVTVFSEKNAIVGNIVCARVTIINPVENTKDFEKQIKLFCKGKIQSYKIPVKINISSEAQYTQRFKKTREQNVD